MPVKSCRNVRGCADLLQAVLQDLEGLGQVPRLAPGPRREERAARRQGHGHHGQGRPDDAQLAHSPPLQNPMHSWRTTAHQSRVRLPSVHDGAGCTRARAESRRKQILMLID